MLSDAFRAYDRDGGGRISAYDFRKALSQFGIKSGINPILKRFQSNDGSVNYSDFLTYFDQVRTSSSARTPVSSNRPAPLPQSPAAQALLMDEFKQLHSPTTAAAASVNTSSTPTTPRATGADASHESPRFVHRTPKSAHSNSSSSSNNNHHHHNHNHHHHRDTPLSVLARERNRIDALVRTMDVEGVGVVTTNDFRTSLEAAGIDPSHPSIQRVVSTATKGDYVQYDRVLSLVDNPPPSAAMAASSAAAHYTVSSSPGFSFLLPDPASANSANSANSADGMSPMRKFKNAPSHANEIDNPFGEVSSKRHVASPESSEIVHRPSKRMVAPPSASESTEDIFVGAHKKRLAHTGADTTEHKTKGDPILGYDAESSGKTRGSSSSIKANFFKFVDSEDSPFAVPGTIKEDVELRKVREILAGKLGYNKATLTRMFRDFDVNGDGVISVDEFRNGLNQLGVNLSEDRFQLLVKKTDANGDGDIDFGEFSKVMRYDSEVLSEDPYAKSASALKRQRSIKIFAQKSSINLEHSEELPQEETPVSPKKISATYMRSSSDVQDKKELEASARRDARLRAKIVENILQKNAGASIRDIFRSFDLDHNGFVDHMEFRKGLQRLGVQLTVNEFERLVGYVDKDKDGEIDYQEFSSLIGLQEDGDSRGGSVYGGEHEKKSATARKEMSLVRLIGEKLAQKKGTVREMFRELDENHDGSLSFDELKNGCARFGLALDDTEIEMIRQKCDRDHSGEIDVDEFARVFKVDFEHAGEVIVPESQANKRRKNISQLMTSNEEEDLGGKRHLDKGNMALRDYYFGARPFEGDEDESISENGDSHSHVDDAASASINDAESDHQSTSHYSASRSQNNDNAFLFVPKLDTSAASAAGDASSTSGGAQQQQAARSERTPTKAPVTERDPYGQKLKRMLTEEHTPASIRETFRVFDRNRSGVLPQQAFQAALLKLTGFGGQVATKHISHADQALLERATAGAIMPTGEVDYRKFMADVGLDKGLFNDDAHFAKGGYEQAKVAYAAHRMAGQNILAHHEEDLSSALDSPRSSSGMSENVRALVSPRKPRYSLSQSSPFLLREDGNYDDVSSPRPSRRLVHAHQRDSLIATQFRALDQEHGDAPAGASPSPRGLKHRLYYQQPSTDISSSSASSPSASAAAAALPKEMEFKPSIRVYSAKNANATTAQEVRLFDNKRRTQVPDSGDSSVGQKVCLRPASAILSSTASFTLGSEDKNVGKEETPLFVSKKRVADGPKDTLGALPDAPNPLSEYGAPIDPAKKVYKPRPAPGMTDKIREKLYQVSASPRELFTRMAGNKEAKTISVGDLQSALRRMNLEVSSAQLRRIVREATSAKAKDGLTYSQFCNGLLMGDQANAQQQASAHRAEENKPRENRAFKNILAHEEGERVVEGLRAAGSYHSPQVKGEYMSSPGNRRYAAQSPRSSGDIIAWRE
jgi:Ca2+-binding EF-hand superfamily protein